MNELLFRVVLVMLGGALGSALRFGVAVFVQRAVGQPPALATWVVNLLGSFLFGWVLEGSARAANPETWRLFWLTGAMGALTTFSTLMMDTARFAEAERPGWGLVNLLAQNALGVTAIVAGLRVGRWWAGGAGS